MAHRITIDARMLGSSGIGACLRNLLDNLAEIDHEFSFKVITANPDDARDLSTERFQIVQSSAPIYSLAEQWEIARLARGTDMLHSPHYNFPYFYRGKLVVTIHDLTHLVQRQFLPGRSAYLYARFMLGEVARRAHTIVTDSQFSMRSIEEHFKAAGGKVRVIYPAPAARILKADCEGLSIAAPGVTGPYLLYVGALKRHKNVEGLVRAYALLPQGLRNQFQLVLAGKEDDAAPAIRKLIQDLKLTQRVEVTGLVSDDQLRALYAAATAFALVSLNEGFGLPALEAMAYGVPVVASNISSLPEVVGDAGILVDPLSDRSIAVGLQQLLDDPGLRRELGQRGRQRARTFSAREFALQHLEVYREALRA